MNQGIPLDTLTKGGIGDAMATNVVAPFVQILNTVIGILAAIGLAYAVFHLVLRVKDLVAGKRDLRSMTGDFLGIGVAMIVLMMCLTNAWYPLLNWVFNNIIQPILGHFK